MSINDPIVIWGLGVILLIVSAFIAHLDRQIAANRKDIEVLKQQMVEHNGTKDTLDRMYEELRALTTLTHRIAGHLNIS